MISSSSNFYFTFTRQTDFVLTATTATASMTPTYSLRLTSYLEVTVTGGTSGTGTVVLTGTDGSGSSQTRTLTFANNGVQQTVKRFKTLTTIATTGLADEATVATVSIRAVSADGTSQLIRAEAAASRPVQIQMLGGAAWRTPTQGSQETGNCYIFLDYEEVWTPRVGDLATQDGTTEVWLVKAVEQVRVGFGVRPAQWRLTAERYET